MWALLLPWIEKLVVAVAPAALKWIGNEALDLVTGHVAAEQKSRADQQVGVSAQVAVDVSDRATTEKAIAQAEANAPKTETDAIARLKDHTA